MKSKRHCKTDPLMRPRQGKVQVARSLVEKLDSRVYLCTDPVGDKPFGDVPWLTSAVTFAEGHYEADHNSGGTSTDGATPADPLPRATTTPAPIRINAGGTNYTDPSGAVWAGDKLFVGGTGDNTWVFPVANTTADPLYYARRWGAFSYNIPVAANGTYTLRLHFVDPKYSTAGNRVFSVKAEGGTILNNFDIAAQAGAKAALVKSFNVAVNDGTLNLNFIKIKESPIVSGIEVLASTVSPPVTPPPPPTDTSSFPTSINWKNLPNSPTPRAEGTAFTVNGKMFVFGGFVGPKLAVTRQVDVFNPATNAWSQAAPMPDSVTHASAAVDPKTGVVWVGMFFLRNGISSSQLVYKYDSATNTWSNGPNLPQARGAGAMAVLGRELHAWGGLDAGQKGRNEHWRLNLDNPSAGWVLDTPMPQTVNHHGGVSLNGKLYSIGGITDKVEFSSNRSTVLTYSAADRTWKAGPTLPTGLGHIGPTTAVGGGKIVIAGGQVNAGGETMIRNVYVYDPNQNKWLASTLLPSGRKSSGTVFINGKIYVATGNMSTSPYLANQLWVS